MPNQDGDQDNFSDDLPTPPEHPLPEPDAIELDGFKLDVSHFLSKDYDDIATASIELPAIIEWVNCKLQSILEQKMLKSDEIDELEAKTYFYMVNGGWEDLGYAGKKTSHAIGLSIKLDTKVKAAKTDLAVISGWYLRLSNVMSSLQAKLELVRSAEATRRRIFDSQVTHQ